MSSLTKQLAKQQHDNHTSVLEQLAAGHHASAQDDSKHGSKAPDEKAIRARILSRICQLLSASFKQAGDNATDKHKCKYTKSPKKIQEMAVVLEEHLFQTAATYDEFENEETLPKRLQCIVNHCRRRKSSWQRQEDDLELRREMIRLIAKMIKARLPPDTDKEYMTKRVPLMAQRLEESLYREAPTKAEYADEATLENRLTAIALENFTIYRL